MSVGESVSIPRKKINEIIVCLTRVEAILKGEKDD